MEIYIIKEAATRSEIIFYWILSVPNHCSVLLKGYAEDCIWKREI